MRLRALRVVATATALVTGVLVPLGEPPAGASVAYDTVGAVDFAHSQGYRSSVGVLDLSTGQFWGAGDYEAAYASESLIKLFIATRLLVTGQMSGYNETTAYKMVTQSDDASANALYGRVGGDGLIDWVKATYNIPDLGTRPLYSGNWGGTNLTAHGFASFYWAISHDARVWPWVDNAIHHATPYGSDGQYQYFGIPQATTDFGVKQGWGDDDYPNRYPEFNSTGVVDADRYAVVILTQGGVYGQPIMNVISTEAKLLLPGGAITPAPSERLGIVSGGWARVKEGGLGEYFIDEASPAREVVLSGARIGVLLADGTAWVKEGGLGAGWALEARGVSDLQLAGSRIAVLRSDGLVLVKDGGLGAGWSAVADSVTAIALSPKRVGITQTDGRFLVKDGDLGATWTQVDTAATSIAVTDTRVAEVLPDGTTRIKDGALSAGWTTLTVGSARVVLGGNRIGVLQQDGNAFVKDAPEAAWVLEARAVAQLQVSASRIGVVLTDGRAFVKADGISGYWAFEGSGSSQVALG